MADLSTSYMGINLKSPIVVGACALSKQLDRIKQIEQLGAGALVIKSLFQEQIELERDELEKSLNYGTGLFSEATSFFPDLEHSGAKEHLFWVESARKAVDMPLIASLNATQKGNWVTWAKQLEETGVQGLELNMFAIGADVDKSSADLEKGLLDTVQAVQEEVSIPVAVKLGNNFTGLGHFAKKLEGLGVKGLVLFNRFFQPDIDVASAAMVQRREFSSSAEANLALRWMGLLSGRVKTDLIASTGIHDGASVVKMLLAGATAVQVVSALYKNKVDHLKTMTDELSAWMDDKGHANIAAFRGSLSHHKLPDPTAYERAQYIKLLLGHD